MKRYSFGAAMLAVLLAAAPASAQLPSSYDGAAVLPYNSHVFGAYVPVSSHAVGLLAQLRLSFFPGVDFGFQGGLSRLDRPAGNRTVVRLGTDVRLAIVKATDGQPVDVAVGGALGVLNGDDYSVLSLGPTVLASRTWRRGQAGEATPYAGLGLSFSTINQRANDHTDFAVPLKIGGQYAISQAAKVVAEIEFRLGQEQGGDDVGFAAGVNMPF